jgi:hypothetical protein
VKKSCSERVQAGPGVILGRVEVGEVLLVDDAATGFDRNKPGRPCMVVRLESPPRGGAWVVPRSTEGSTGTSVPAGALPGLNKDGRFQFVPRRVGAADLACSRSLGLLPDPHRTRVLENVNMVVIEFEVEL